MYTISIDDLKKRKQALHLTNEELARLSKVPLGTVQKVMGTTTRHPRRETILALAKVLAPKEAKFMEASDKGTYLEYELPILEGSTGNGIVREGAPALKDLPLKRQGEYTLEDYYAWPEEQRIELIDGVIYDMGAPIFKHQDIAGEIYYQLRLAMDAAGSDCLPGISPIDVQLDCDNRTMVQPDVFVICDNSKNINKCIYGAPDLAVEVLSPSSRKRDQIIKLNKYINAGVREYWIVDPENERVIVYFFEKEAWPDVYTFDDTVPVGISGGKCSVDFSRVKARLIKFFSEK